MLILPGSPALSSFRRDRLLAEMQALVPVIDALSADHVHLVQITDAWSATDQERLLALLGEPTAPMAEAGELLLVVPRPGTISPWSSRASDIAAH